MKINTVLMVCLLITVTLNDTFVRKVPNLDPQALCLDGQPAFLYMKQGVANAKGLLIYFMSAPSLSFCGNSTLFDSLESCLIAQSQIQSFWKSTLQVSEGIVVQPLISEWHKIIIPYCDGALFQGYAKTATRYKTKDLYFRGNKIVKAHFQYIDQQIYIYNLERIVVAGSGVGAIGALAWSRYFRDEIVMKRGNIKYQLIVDSFPQSYPSFRTGKNQYETALQNLLKLANTDDSHPFTLCAIRNQGQEQKCFLLDQGYQYLNFPVMNLQSQYDPFTLAKALQIFCNDQQGSFSTCSAPQKQYLQRYRSQRMIALFQFANYHDSSFWSLACWGNGFLGRNYNSSTYVVNRFNNRANPSKAIRSFLQQDRITLFDSDSWPQNSVCSGMK